MPSFEKGLRFIEDSNSFYLEGKGQLIRKAFISRCANILDCSLQDLADDTFLSDATISRFFKSLGYPVYPAVKNEFYDFLNEVRILMIKREYGRKKSVSQEERIFRDIRKAVHAEAKKEYEKAAQILAESEYVMFTGEMNELTAFFPLQVLLISCRCAAYFVRSAEMLRMPETLLRRRVTVVTLTDTKDHAEEIEILREKLGMIRVIAFGRNNPVDADVRIPYEKPPVLAEEYEDLMIRSRILLDEYLNRSDLKPK